MLLSHLFKRRPPLTPEEQARKKADAELAAKVQHLRQELEAEAEAACEIISDVLEAMNICYRYRKKEGMAERVKKIRFKRPLVVTEEALYLPVDLSARGRPRGVTIEQLTDLGVLKNISGEVRRVVTAEFTEADGLFFVVWRNQNTRGIPSHVMYDDMLRLRPATAGHLAFPLGMTVGKKPVWANLAEFPSMLVLGTSGGGKSNLLNVLIATISNHCSPRYLRWVLVDFKRLEFSFYYGLPHVLERESAKMIVNDAETLVETLDWLKQEMERRIRVLEDAKVKKLSEYNQHRKGPHMPFIYLVVDELAEVMLTPKLGRAAMELLINLAAKGRAVGVSLILCTQYAKSEVVDMRLKANLQAIIAFPLPNLNASVAMLGNKSAYEISGRGRCIFQHEHRQLEVQVPLMSTSTLEAMLAAISAGKKYQVDAHDEKDGKDKERQRHDVDDYEIVDWALRERDGEISLRGLAEHFAARGMTERLARQWLEKKDTATLVDSAGAQYQLIRGGPGKPAWLRMVKEDEEDVQAHHHEDVSAESDTGGAGPGPAETAHEISERLSGGDENGRPDLDDTDGRAGPGDVVVEQ